MEIPFQGRFDESILRRTTLTALRPERGMLLFILLGVFALAWSFIVFPLLHGEPVDLTLIVSVLVAVALLAFITFIWGPKKQLQSKLVQGQFEGMVGDERIHLETPYSTVNLPWDVFVRAKISQDVVLLYNSTIGDQVQLFPREFFASESDWTAFVELVRQRVTPKVAAKKSLKWRPWLMFLIWMVVFVLILIVYNAFQASGR